MRFTTLASGSAIRKTNASSRMSWIYFPKVSPSASPRSYLSIRSSARCPSGINCVRSCSWKQSNCCLCVKHSINNSKTSHF
jgi:hypothetical protein